MVLRRLLFGCLLTCSLAQSVFAQDVTCQAFYVPPQDLPFAQAYAIYFRYGLQELTKVVIKTNGNETDYYLIQENGDIFAAFCERWPWHLSPRPQSK
jgi:hypothetical protein